MSKEELEQRVLGIQAAQDEVMQKMAAMGVPTMQAWQQQQQHQQHQQFQSKNLPRQNQYHGRRGGGGGGGHANSGTNSNNHTGNHTSNAQVFSMIFGESRNGSAASIGNGAPPTFGGAGPCAPPPFVSPWGPAVPPIPPPPGGWPPGAAPSAATAAAAIAAFATSIGEIVPAASSASYPPHSYPSRAGPNGAGSAPVPIPAGGGDCLEGGGGGGGGGRDATEANSAAWLDYYDACLRARGVNGGIAEFEEFAQLTGQGTTSAVASESRFAGEGTTSSSSSSGGAWCHRRGMPQDRPIGGDGDDGDYLPAEFEYDDTNVKDYGLSEEKCFALEAEEEEQRIKKAAKKRDKKARQKERAKTESEAKAAVASMKKRDKAITSWRSRVVAACFLGDAKKMDALVGESPFKNYVYDPTPFISLDHETEDGGDDDDRPTSQEEYLLRQMNWFLSNCIQKYQTQTSSHTTSRQLQPFANNIAREKLARYILSVSFDAVLFQSPFTQNRNAMHSAAYRNDANFIQWIIECQQSNDVKDISIFDFLCQDGGWAPLHYATAGGSTEVVELLLRQGVCVTTRTNRSLTCFTR